MTVHLPCGAALAAALVSLVAITFPLTAGAQGGLPPATAQQSTYLGGTSTDSVNAVMQNSDGDVVVVGTTSSQSLAANASETEPRPDGLDIFVAYFERDGATPLETPTLIFGGTGDEEVTAATLGPGNVLYVVGKTTSVIIPNVTNYRTAIPGQNAFLARINPDGTPDWFMFLSGSGQDEATGVAVLGDSVYVSGATDSTDFMGRTGNTPGGTNGFVVRVEPTQTPPAIGWGGAVRLVGGGSADSFLGITAGMSGGGKLLAVGTTSSGFLMVPPSTVVNNSPIGGSDAFVAQLDAATSDVEWITYVGGSGADEGKAIARGPTGSAPPSFVIAGTTNSTDLVAGPVPLSKNAFVAWLNESGIPRFIQVRGGEFNDEVLCATTADNGVAYIGGRTASTDFQGADSGFDSVIEAGSGFREGFVWTVSPEGGDGWASFVGGAGVDEVLALSHHLTDKLIIGLRTESASGLPGTPIYDGTANNAPDGYVLSVKVNDLTLPEPGMVYDRLQQDDEHEDVDVTTSTTALFANWTAFSDTQTDIVKYEWAIGTAQNPTSVRQFTPVSQQQLSASATGLSLMVGETYIFTVRAQNGHGLTSIARSNGITVMGPPGPDAGTDGGMGGTDGGTGGTDGGTGVDGGTDGGADGGTDGGTGGLDGGSGGDGGPGEEPGEPVSPVGWELGCASAGGAALPLFMGLLALMLLRRRLGQR